MRKNSQLTLNQTMRRKLRSASKHFSKDHTGTGLSSDEKAIQQIQKQFDNQQSINHSKSTALIQDDGRGQLFDSLSYCMRTRRTRYADLPKPKHDNSLASDILTKEVLQEVVPIIVAPVIEQQIQPPQPQPVIFCQPQEFITPVKQEVYHSKADETLFGAKLSKRSGRRHKRSSVSQVPFRKFQDSFEQKIVVLINRIYHKKCNDKDFEMFIEKLQKISNKQLYNPYVISGVKTVLNLIERPNLLQARQVARFSQEIKRLSGKIWEELGKTDDYEDVQIERKEIDFEEIRPKLIKKIYKMIVESKKYALCQARQKSVQVTECFFANYDHYSREEDLLSFFRQRKFLTC